MRVVFSFLIFFTLNVFVWAQLPEWTDFNNRQKMYPNEEYLVGYSSESGIKKTDLQPSFDYIEQLARGELVEKVQVNVTSVSTSETKDYDGVYNDFFRNETASKSTLNLVGLKSLQYYDKKKKTTHIVVYVKRIELIRYYRSQVDQFLSRINSSISEGEKLLNEQHIQESFKAIYASHNLFKEVEQSQKYLTALGVHSFEELRINEFEKAKKSAQELLRGHENKQEKTLDDVSYCTSLVLSGHAKEVKDSLFVEQISFEETGLNTAFTYRYQQILQQQLSDNSNYALQKSKSDYSKMLVRGTYWDKGEYLEIKTELYNTITKNTEGSYKTKLYKSKIEAGLEYISSDISKLEGIKDLVIKASNTQLKGQVGFDVKEDLKLTITDKSGKRIAGVPVKFVDEDNKIEYGVASSNNSGTVVFHINRLKSGNKSQTITAKLDLDTYLTIDKENSYVQNVLKFTSLPASKFYLTVKPSQIYFKVNERNFGVRLGVPVIESGLKDQLSDAGYSFIEDRNKSDLIVTINADTRKGGEVSGIYFSYVDITVSVAQRASGKEVFKKSFNNYKASGSSFEHAGGKAYQVAKKEVCNQVIELMAK